LPDGSQVLHFLMVFYPIENAIELIDKFLNRTLPKDEWTHEAHLMVGLHHATTYGAMALVHLRENISKYNEATTVINSTTTGYHETITHFWLWAVQKYCQKDGILIFDQETLDDMLWTEELAERNLWLAYYSKDLMLSTAARMSLAMPDVKNFD
jgi:hypothetical protein